MGTEKKAPSAGEPAYVVALECDPDEDAEDRLLQVYELLLGLSGAPEIDLEGSETTCYEPGAIRVCPCDAEEPQGQGVTG